jgi:hypothetical protein
MGTRLRLTPGDVHHAARKASEGHPDEAGHHTVLKTIA